MDQPVVHTIRVSDKAKRVRLVMSPRDGLVVVVPKGYPLVDVPRMLRRHASWIQRAGERVAERRDHMASAGDAPVPDRVDMPGIGLTWDVVLVPGTGEAVRGRVVGETLVLRGSVHDRDRCLDAIRRAVARAARERLPLFLGGLEAETGWSASRVSVRRQRSRWGSCTSAAAISLNSSLVFLPARLVRYVLLHELAHTVRLDHSPAFWSHVELHDADWRGARAALKEAWRHVPPWVERD